MNNPESVRSTPPIIDELRWVRPPDPLTTFPHPASFLAPIEQPETLWQKGMRKTKENPMVPLGVLATTAALTFGLIQMQRGNSVLQQYAMRGRIAGQAFTIAGIVLGVMYAASKKV